MVRHHEHRHTLGAIPISTRHAAAVAAAAAAACATIALAASTLALAAPAFRDAAHNAF